VITILINDASTANACMPSSIIISIGIDLEKVIGNKGLAIVGM
jgi:hypothetical protein